MEGGMAATLAKTGWGANFPDGFGLRTFGRAMSWVCLGLSALLVVVAAGSVAADVTLASGGLTACGPPVGAAAVRTCPSGSITMTSQVVYAPDGHVISRKTLPGPPPDMTRWSPATFGGLAWIITPLLLAAALWQGSRFFADLARGRVLQASTVRRLRNFSMLGVAFLLSDALLESVVNAVLGLFSRQTVRFAWPFMIRSPQAQAGWTLSGSLLLEIVFAAVLIAMVSVLARAAAIAEDHAQIV
jgi:hypothetical protein